MARAFIGVGANIEPEANIRAALRLLSRRVHVTAISTFYRTPAEERPGQPDYLNGVVSIETGLSPRTLKNFVLRAIERALGRRRSEDRYAARPIDLDLLLYDSLRLDEPGLRLPSEDIETRPFVAIPLAEIAPDLELPGRAVGVSALAARFSRESLEPLATLTNQLRLELGCPLPLSPGTA